MKYRTGIGQDSHRFLPEDSNKPCIIGGLIFENVPGLMSDSDGDVVFHAICNAITSLTGVQILGGIAAELCEKDGITDSQVYVAKALETLGSQKIEHLALAIEGKQPRLNSRIDEMRAKLAEVLKLHVSQVGISATTSDGLTEFGLGSGIRCFCVITTKEF
ncbi:MAG TPA: 2-C-methyl-D-erythritol 2,4-cyclodiphosphate synthase [Rhabdochlamydiaceae bacterium]|nr:2-C-methyl-D-erythritol 2,4-cyclodiphosphate synthase [Rhabdochlamydiaceae bacterium]